MHSKKHFLLLLGFWISSLLILSSCGGGSSFSRPNVNYLYDFKSLAPRPNYLVYHVNNDTSRVYYRISSSELLYMRDEAQGLYEANFSITYKLVESLENPISLDTANFELKDQASSPGEKVIFGYFNVSPKVGFEAKKYVLDIEIRDNNRKLVFNNFISIDRSSAYGSQNFLLTDTSGTPLFKNHVPRQIPFRLRHNSGIQEAYVSLYDRSFPLALPPYSSAPKESFELRPDTTFLVQIDTILRLNAKGFFHFRTDSSQWKGFTVYSYYNQFPYIAKREHMIGPMRYLTTKREYDNLLESKESPQELRKAVDEFWLRRSGSVERSKILLSSYFNRVQEANLFFTSYVEGWKTDRGIVYTIYGPPDKVYRFNESEAWIYGDENSSLSYYFTFVKLNNPFSDNDYSLNRSSGYRYGWGQAIEGWRNGKVYNSRDIQQEQNDSDQWNRAQQRAPYWY
jgi:GWxTD domain-containing protein